MFEIINITPTVMISKIKGEIVQSAMMCYLCDEVSGVKIESYTENKRIITELRTKNKQDEKTIYVPAVDDVSELNVSVFNSSGEIISDFKTVWKPQRRWRVHFIPTTHHDLGYTEPVEPLLTSYCDYYRAVMSFCDTTSGYPKDSEYRYTVEELWSLDEFFRRADDTTKKRFISLIKQGRIEVSALFANIIDGICSDEEIIRLLYASAKMQQEYDIPVETACLVDIPGMSSGTIEALCAAGIKYLFAGFPKYFEWIDTKGVVPPMKHSFWDEKSLLPNGRPQAFRWKAKSDKNVLTWYQAGYGWFGNDEIPCIETDSFDVVEEYLPRFLKEIEDKGSPYSVMRYIDHGSDNQMPKSVICDIVKRWNEKYLSPHLIVSTNTAFFNELESQCGEPPELNGGVEHTDYTVLSLSAAKESTENAVNRQEISSAESLDCFASIISGSKPQTDLIGNVYKDIMLYDEHCFGMNLSFSAAHEYSFNAKRNFVVRAAYNIRNIKNGAFAKIASSINASNGSYVAVFNPSSTVYSGVVAVSDSSLPPEGFEIFDEKGKKTAVQTVIADAYDLPRKDCAPMYAAEIMGGHMLPHARTNLFIAEDVPPMGLKIYLIAEKAQTVNSSDELSIENEYYHVYADEKSGIHIYDKSVKREISNSSGRFFGQVLSYDIKNDVLHEQSVSSIVTGMCGDIANSLVVRGNVFGCNEITQEIILFKGENKVEISVLLNKNSVPFNETFAVFPFDGKAEEFGFRSLLGLQNAFSNIIAGTNTHHRAVNGYAYAKTDTAKYTLVSNEAKIMEFGKLRPTAVSQAHHGIHPAGFCEPYDTEMGSDSDIYAMLTYNNCQTNFAPTQNGNVLYKFALTSGEGSSEDFYEKQHCAPLCACFNVSEKNDLKSVYITDSLISVDDRRVKIICFKGAEDGGGYILRLYNSGESDSVCSVRFSFDVTNVYIADATERNLEPLTVQDGRVSFNVKAGGIVTLKII